MTRKIVALLLLFGLILPGLTGCIARQAQQVSPAASQPAGKTAPRVASYSIQVSLDTQGKTLSGHEVISYTNTTQAPIPDLVFHLYLNAFKDANTTWMKEAGGESRNYSWDPAHPGWIQVSGLRVKNGPSLELQIDGDETLQRAALPSPINPGDTGVFELDFKALLPKAFARTGFASQATGYDYFMVGQWFPKLGVWQNGAWNAYIFHANSEFYADFGTYQVDITLPENYVTGGGGVQVSSQSNGNGTKTVRYRSDQVIDFSWTASPHFREAHRQVGGTDILYLYLPEHSWSVQRVLDAAGTAFSLYSGWYGPYPYPHLTVVDTPDDGEGAGGMEYPTLITAGTMSQLGVKGLEKIGIDRSLEVVTMHETGHQWFQSMVATNEAEEPWLDEGFTDYSALRALNARFGEASSMLHVNSIKISYLEVQRLNYMSAPDYPMGSRAWDYPNLMDYSSAVYSKPDLSLSTLEHVLGEEMMAKVMSTYFQTYQFAHPTTADFRRVAESISGEDLSWFFDELVYGSGTLDYSVQSIDQHAVTVNRQGKMSLPTDVQVTFSDGSQVNETWDGLPATKTYQYPDHPAISSAEVDPQRKLLVDMNWSNNGLRQKSDLWSWSALVTRLFYFFENGLLYWGGL